MAEIENIHCPICTQPIPRSWQNALPPALATDEQRGEGTHSSFLTKKVSEISMGLESVLHIETKCKDLISIHCLLSGVEFV